MYSVRYGTGAGDMEGFETIEAAQLYADEHASYTQQPIIITDEDGTELCIRRWWGVQYDERCPEEDPILFAAYGYYSDWEDLD